MTAGTAVDESNDPQVRVDERSPRVPGPSLDAGEERIRHLGQGRAPVEFLHGGKLCPAPAIAPPDEQESITGSGKRRSKLQGDHGERRLESEQREIGVSIDAIEPAHDGLAWAHLEAHPSLRVRDGQLFTPPG